MENLIYNVYHNHAVRLGEVENLWSTALSALNMERYPKFDRLRSVVTVLSHNLQQDYEDQREQYP